MFTRHFPSSNGKKFGDLGVYTPVSDCRGNVIDLILFRHPAKYRDEYRMKSTFSMVKTHEIPTYHDEVTLNPDFLMAGMPLNIIKHHHFWYELFQPPRSRHL